MREFFALLEKNRLPMNVAQTVVIEEGKYAGAAPGKVWNGKIAEEWVNRDEPGVLISLGILKSGSDMRRAGK